MTRIAFQVELVKVRNAVRLRVPLELGPALGSERLLPVLITINGHSVRATLHKMGGTYMTAVNKTVQQLVGGTAGDIVDVTIEPESPADQRIDIPDDLAAALSRADARSAFDQLTTFRQREIVNAVSSAKKPDTRIRRINQAAARLADVKD